MKAITNIIIFCGLLVSCYKPYTAEIDSKEKEVLVVEGLITNEVAPYQISLSYALPFYSGNTRLPVKSALIYVFDDKGNNYRFRELKNGYYISDPLIFTGQPGRTYSLYIGTPDGEIYLYSGKVTGRPVL